MMLAAATFCHAQVSTSLDLFLENIRKHSNEVVKPFSDAPYAISCEIIQEPVDGSEPISVSINDVVDFAGHRFFRTQTGTRKNSNMGIAIDGEKGWMTVYTFGKKFAVVGMKKKEIDDFWTSTVKEPTGSYFKPDFLKEIFKIELLDGKEMIRGIETTKVQLTLRSDPKVKIVNYVDEKTGHVLRRVSDEAVTDNLSFMKIGEATVTAETKVTYSEEAIKRNKLPMKSVTSRIKMLNPDITVDAEMFTKDYLKKAMKEE